LLGLSILAITAYPTFAINTPSTAVMPIIRKGATASGATGTGVIKQRLETRKENIEDRITAMREKLASRAAALKTKLQTFKDQRKAVVAERVNTNLNNINQNQTAQMQKHLNTMSEILDKLEARVNKGTPDIKDPAKAKTAIAAARATISTASAAVSAQAAKDYTIQVTSEGKIRIDAKTQRDNLHKDLLATRKTVQDAKQAVANAVRIAKSGVLPTKTGKIQEGTSSGQ